MTLKMISLFSGIGAFEKALTDLGIDYDLVYYCEIDKYASKAYSMIHGISEDKNLWDINNIDLASLPKVDLVTYGFPCQDISVAGKGKGFYDDNGNITRSGLFFKAADVIKVTQPKFAIFENVKNLVGKRFKNEFKTVLDTLDSIGYHTYFKVLNAKDYGIPQNRERVFGVSIRKDIDKMFYFPQPVELRLRLKDMLESIVDDKYYLSDEIQQRFKFTDNTFSKSVIGNTKPSFRTIGIRDLVYQENGVMGSLIATDYKQPKQILETKRIGGCFDDEKGNHQAGSVYDKDGLSPTLSTMQGGYRQPCVIVKEATKKGYDVATIGDSINLEQPNSQTRRGRVGKGVAQTLTTGCNQAVIEPLICASRGKNLENPNSRKAGEPTGQRIEINYRGCSNTLTTVQKDNYVLEPTYRIRKLTPRECWRLMGFKDDDFDKVKGISDTQLYKQAGNSIVVNVVKALFNELNDQYGLEELGL